MDKDYDPSKPNDIDYTTNQQEIFDESELEDLSNDEDEDDEDGYK